MTKTFIDPVAEVRQNREELLEAHGGIDGLHKFMDNERPGLERDGWKFVTLKQVRAKKSEQSSSTSRIAAR